MYETNPEILKKQILHQNSELKTQNIEHLKNMSDSKSSIQIATPSKNYQVRNEKVRVGLFVHELLSRINTPKDVDRVLETYVLDGQITLEEKTEIKSVLMKIIDAHTEFFDEKWQVINEKDIMISENGMAKIYRPDRILKNNEGYIILDFKTGSENEKNEKQIETYKSVLEKLGKKVLKTKLIYIS